MEDYEKKYKQALERAATELETCGADKNLRNMIYAIFPDELKESEDEKIRKALIRFHKSTIDVDGIKGADILAWLEKQGKSSDQIHYWTEEEIEPIISDYLRGVEHYGGMIGRLRYLKPKSLEKQNDCSVKWQKNTPNYKPAINHSVLMKTTQGIAEGEWQGEYWFQYRWSWTLKDSDVLAWMELSNLDEQGEQKPAVVDFNAKDWYVSKVDGKIHDMTYNPADKVESKFKVGDWVVDNRTGVIHYIANIKGTVNGCYYVFGNDKGLLHIDNEEDYHIWTIQDAKDGDVLVDKCGNIGIYQGDKNALRWNSYCYCGLNKVFYDEGSHEFPCYPATKEQQDTLEKAMADAGYTFDFEKKELKKPQRMISAEAKEALYDKVEPKFNIGDVLCDKSCTTLDKNSQPNIEILDIRNDMYICNNCSFPISQQDEYELVAKRIVPQSAAWSDEDEKMADDLIEGFQSQVKVYNLVHTSKEIADWLKSLKDRIGG